MNSRRSCFARRRRWACGGRRSSRMTLPRRSVDGRHAVRRRSPAWSRRCPTAASGSRRSTSRARPRRRSTACRWTRCSTLPSSYAKRRRSVDEHLSRHTRAQADAVAKIAHLTSVFERSSPTPARSAGGSSSCSPRWPTNATRDRSAARSQADASRQTRCVTARGSWEWRCASLPCLRTPATRSRGSCACAASRRCAGSRGRASTRGRRRSRSWPARSTVLRGHLLELVVGVFEEVAGVERAAAARAS